MVNENDMIGNFKDYLSEFCSFEDYSGYDFADLEKLKEDIRWNVEEAIALPEKDRWSTIDKEIEEDKALLSFIETTVDQSEFLFLIKEWYELEKIGDY